MLKIRYHSTFKKDYKRIKKRGYNLELLSEVINILANQQDLPEHYHDHALTGN